MYSPVFLSCPTTSGSPPVRSISWSDQSFSLFASSFACTLAHSTPLWRFRCFSKRAFNVLSRSLRCCGKNCFFLLVMFFILPLPHQRKCCELFVEVSGVSRKVSVISRPELHGDETLLRCISLPGLT